MVALVRIYSMFPDEIDRFLNDFYGKNNYEFDLKQKHWQKEYPNPVEISDIVGAYVENIDNYKISLWVSMDPGVFVKVSIDNSDELIRYLFERFPY